MRGPAKDRRNSFDVALIVGSGSKEKGLWGIRSRGSRILCLPRLGARGILAPAVGSLSNVINVLMVVEF